MFEEKDIVFLKTCAYFVMEYTIVRTLFLLDSVEDGLQFAE